MIDDESILREYDKTFIDKFNRTYAERYSRYSQALANIEYTLRTLIADKLAESDVKRITIGPGRVKSKNRLLKKARSDGYVSKINQPNDIFEYIYDIVGMRITCNTGTDVLSVIAAIEHAAENGKDGAKKTLIRPFEKWKDDYIAVPKDSGYRAIHLLVGVPVQCGSKFEEITCEVQVRTLLQHAWGELTHEDTYKPGVPVPSIIKTLSKRLATALSVMDEIAQDIRNELKKLEDPTQPLEAREVVVTELASEQRVLEEEGHASQLASVAANEVTGKVFNIEEAESSYQRVYGDSPAWSDAQRRALGNHAEQKNIDNRTFEEMLAKCKDQLKILQMPFTSSLNSFGNSFHSIEICSDEAHGTENLAKALERADKVHEGKRIFAEKYKKGNEVTGTVVNVMPTFALILLPTGDTGILHATKMKKYEGEFVVIREHFNEGDDIKVKIFAADMESKRIELEYCRD